MVYAIHHINCASFCPRGAKLINGRGGWLEKALMPCHCLLVETSDGLVLLDAGFSTHDMQDRSRLWPGFYLVGKLTLDPQQCALSHVIRLGFKREDVRHIILTHLDSDHAGGITDFPQAKIHILQREYDAAMHPRTFWEKSRYNSKIWQKEPLWQRHHIAGEKWKGFDCVRPLSVQISDILLIPLHGHSPGHCGVAIRSQNGWLLHCGDAYLDHREIERDSPWSPPVMTLLQLLDESSRSDRLHNLYRLRALYRQHQQDVQIICSHDICELERCQHATKSRNRLPGALNTSILHGSAVEGCGV